MLRLLFTHLFVFAALPMSAATQTALAPPADLAQVQLRAINHRFVNAFAAPDHAWMAALTAQDFLLTSAGGDWLTREQHLQIMRERPLPRQVSYDNLQVRLFGDVALLHGVFEAVNASNTQQRMRCTDVYHWNGVQWQLVSAQSTAIKDNVSNAINRAPEPAHTAWQGQDPSGEDEAVLFELNANYVKAFREANVGWYAAHLAPDYVVISSDGSLNDRARALADFAKPTFANFMKSFPVDKVQIRRFGDVALIHAENAYEMKDGRTGISRYTDIWHKQANGKWLCIAAHITAHKVPG
jgi:ketosteroid isomerase-like protein